MREAIHQDEIKLQQTLEQLKHKGYLEYTGEYGAELTTFLPFVAWLNQEGLLKQRKIISYNGMRPYYFFLSNEQFSEKNEKRHWLAEKYRYWPSSSTYTATAKRWHVYPNYRKHYQAAGQSFDKPIIFIQNKFIMEWGLGPINYIPLMSLGYFLEQTKHQFTVIYSRPTRKVQNSDYVEDTNAELDYPDRSILQNFKHTIDLEELCINNNLHYNQTKLEMMAKTNIFIGVQGGGSHAIAYFDNSLLLLLHNIDCLGAREQYEYPHAYKHGPYKYLNNNSLTLAVACNIKELGQGLFGVSKISIDNNLFSLSGEALTALKPLLM